MTLQQNIGVPFSLKKDWKALFQRDAWFLWRRPVVYDKLVLKRFTLFNVIRWYIIQIVLKIVVLVLHPVFMIAYDYWNPIEEAQDEKVVERAFLRIMPEIKFFRLDKDYGKN